MSAGLTRGVRRTQGGCRASAGQVQQANADLSPVFSILCLVLKRYASYLPAQLCQAMLTSPSEPAADPCSNSQMHWCALMHAGTHLGNLKVTLA